MNLLHLIVGETYEREYACVPLTRQIYNCLFQRYFIVYKNRQQSIENSYY